MKGGKGMDEEMEWIREEMENWIDVQSHGFEATTRPGCVVV